MSWKNEGFGVFRDFGKKDNRQGGEREARDVEAGSLHYEQGSVSLSADRHDI